MGPSGKEGSGRREHVSACHPRYLCWLPCRSRLSPGDHAPEEAPQPCARDRASMTAVGPGKLLLVGGADSLNRRLDDAWLFDLQM